MRPKNQDTQKNQRPSRLADNLDQKTQYIPNYVTGRVRPQDVQFLKTHDQQITTDDLLVQNLQVRQKIQQILEKCSNLTPKQFNKANILLGYLSEKNTLFLPTQQNINQASFKIAQLFVNNTQLFQNTSYLKCRYTNVLKQPLYLCHLVFLDKKKQQIHFQRIIPRKNPFYPQVLINMLRAIGDNCPFLYDAIQDMHSRVYDFVRKCDGQQAKYYSWKTLTFVGITNIYSLHFTVTHKDGGKRIIYV